MGRSVEGLPPIGGSIGEAGIGVEVIYVGVIGQKTTGIEEKTVGRSRSS